MDHRRFDDAARALNTATTRRKGLAAVLGVLFGGGMAARVSAQDAAASRCPGGLPNGKSCERRTDCCSGICEDGICKCGMAGDDCTFNGACCSGECVFGDDPYTGVCAGECRKEGRICRRSRNCCGSLACIDGRCSSRASCDGDLCPDGCCDGNRCRHGRSDHNCGTGGRSCQTCDSDRGEACYTSAPNTGGVCATACEMECRNGCCKRGVCKPGTGQRACGRWGGACAVCGDDERCRNRKCVKCKPSGETCAAGKECCSGECANGRCKGGCLPANATCSSNAACCSGQCRNGTCAGTKTCDRTTCPKGCCSGTTCKSGGSASACGRNGAVCKRCAAGQSCVNGACAAGPGPSPKNCTVCSASSCPFKTIEAAIAAAAPGDIITIADDGVAYTSALLVDRNLTLEGCGTERPTISPDSTQTAGLVIPTTVTAVTLRNLRFVAVAGSPGSAISVLGVRADNLALTVDTVDVEDWTGVGLTVQGPGTTTLTGSAFASNAFHLALSGRALTQNPAERDSLVATVTGTSFNGGTGEGAAINVTTATATFTDCTIDGYTRTEDKLFAQVGGAGLNIASAAAVTLAGTTAISNNTAPTAGGGVYVTGPATFGSTSVDTTLSIVSTVRISANTAPDGSGIAALTGAVITGADATDVVKDNVNGDQCETAGTSSGPWSVVTNCAF